MDCYIGFDIGTSAVKGVLITADGEIRAEQTEKFTYIRSANSVLLQPEEFLRICFSVINRLAAHAENKYRIAALCPCCASGNLLFLDNDDKPLTHIISWQSCVDETEFAGYYTDDEKSTIYKTVGWPAINSFPVAYFPWLAKNRPEIIRSASKICMSAEYLNFILTGKWGISVSMGTPFYLMEQEKGVYNSAYTEKFGITDSLLPPIYPKGTVLGTVCPSAREFVNLPEYTKIVLGSFDHPSCATGAGVYKTDELLLSCGTSWVEFFPMESREKAIATGFLVDRFMLAGTPYCALNSVTSLGNLIEERHVYFLGNISHGEFDALVSEASQGCGGLRFDFTDRDFGKAGEYKKSDIARAIIESAALLLKENLKEAEKMSIKINKISMVGGITNSDVCMNVIAGVLGCGIQSVNGSAAGAVGAAMLAGIGSGAFKDEYEAFCTVKSKLKQYNS